MPLGGETVGRAYVRIHADGSTIPEEIRDDLTKAEGPIKREGAKHGEAYSKEFADRTSQADLGQGIRNALERSMARADITQSFFGSREWSRFQASVKKQFGDIGQVATKELQDEFNRRGNISGLEAAIDRMYERLWDSRTAIQKAAQEEQNAHWKSILDEAYRMNRSFNEAILKDRLDADKRWELSINARSRAEAEAQNQLQADYRMTATLAAAYREDAERAHRAEREAAKDLTDQYSALRIAAARLVAGKQVEGQTYRTVGRDLDSLREKMKAAGLVTDQLSDDFRDMNRDLFYVHPTLDRTNNSLLRLGDTAGKLSGRGARNDLINFFGSMVRGFALIPLGITKTITKLDDFRRSVALAFDETRDRGGSPLAGLFAGAGAAAGGLTKLIAGFAGATFGAGLLASTITLLIGVLTALASTAILGVIGGLGALAGAFAPLIAGIGVTVLAFQNMPKEAKTALEGVKSEFSGLGEVAGTAVFSNITEQATRFRRVVGGLEPLIREVGQAVSRVGDHWLDLMEGPGFKAFRSAMEKFLPDAVESLGKSIGNAFGGFGGLLRGLIPLTERFLAWFERITEEFNEWANSAQGQNSIKKFFDDAGDSAARLGDFLGAVWDLLGTIMTAGNEAGDSLFGSMTRAIEGWNDALRANPKILKDFFADSVKFGEAIGDLIVGVGKLWDELDNSSTRDAVVFAFESLARAIELVADIIGPVISGFSELNGLTGGLAGTLGAAALVFPRVASGLTGAASGVTGLVGGLRNAETRISRLQGVAKGAAGIAGIAGLGISAQQSNDKLSILGSTASGAVLGWSLGGPWGAAVGAGAGALLGLATNAGKAGDSLDDAERPAADFAATLDRLTGAATQATREMAYLEAKETGLLDQADKLGISHRDMIGAITGNAGASARLSTVMGKLKDSVPAGEFSKFEGDLRDLGFEIETAQEKTNDLARATQPLKDLYTGFPKEVITEIRQLGGDLAFEDIVKLHREYKLSPKEITTALKLNNIDATIQEVQIVAREFKGLPKEVVTDIRNEGYRLSIHQISSMIDRYDLLPRQVRTLLRVAGLGPAKAHTGAMERAYRNLEKKRTALISADTKRAKVEVDLLYTKVRNLPGISAKEAKLILTGDGKKADTVVDKTKTKADNAANSKYEFRITADESDAISGIDSVIAKLRNIDTYKEIQINTVYTTTGSPPRTASGGIFSGSQLREIGEDGPEAVVPLNRPLSQVDPAVRWLSAIAQGLTGTNDGTVTGSRAGRTIDASGWTIVSPQSDPRSVAVEALNYLVATSYTV